MSPFFLCHLHITVFWYLCVMNVLVLHGLEDIVMTNHCGETLRLNPATHWSSDIRFVYHQDLTYQQPSADYECSLNLIASDKLSFYFTEFKLLPSTGKCRAFIQIMAGEVPKNVYGMDNTLCRSRSVTIGRTYTTSETSLYIRVYIYNTVPVRTDILGRQEYYSDVTFNMTYNIRLDTSTNCDGSDCDSYTSQGIRPETIGAICGSILAALCMFVPIGCLLWNRKRRKSRHHLQSSNLSSGLGSTVDREPTYSPETNVANIQSDTRNLASLPSYNTLSNLETTHATPVDSPLFLNAPTHVELPPISRRTGSNDRHARNSRQEEEPPSYEAVVSDWDRYNVGATVV